MAVIMIITVILQFFFSVELLKTTKTAKNFLNKSSYQDFFFVKSYPPID